MAGHTHHTYLLGANMGLPADRASRHPHTRASGSAGVFDRATGHHPHTPTFIFTACHAAAVCCRRHRHLRRRRCQRATVGRCAATPASPPCVSWQQRLLPLPLPPCAAALTAAAAQLCCRLPLLLLLPGRHPACLCAAAVFAAAPPAAAGAAWPRAPCRPPPQRPSACGGVGSSRCGGRW
jgi:hypothetical protein